MNERPIARRKLLWPAIEKIEYVAVPTVEEAVLQRDFPDLEIVIARDMESYLANLSDCEILITWRLKTEHFTRCRKLRYLHSPMAGVTQMMFPALVNSEVMVTNSTTVHATVVAEQTLAMMFAIARRIPSSVRFQERRYWGQEDYWVRPLTPTELSGQTLGIVGFGQIGREIAVRCRALGMKIVALKKNPAQGGDLADHVYGIGEMNSLLAEADYVVLCAPETAENIGLIGAAQLSRMKPTAVLLNVARGSLVVTDDLMAALRAGTIAGAGLDVTDPEPLPADHPLWTAPNVLITPHLGGCTDRFWPRQMALLRDNLQRYLAGRELLNLVDKKKGY
ncbi:MAG: D-2-hydroxyacid dehydrogenase [Acidobacteria bacterium]|nr:D-2-hydroxyacid dehydrogenase [Acidobacteriota bacterium]